MTFLLVFFGLLGAAGGMVGVYFYGLYRGERGRRETVENLLTSGTPNRPMARRLDGSPATDEAAVAKQERDAIEKVSLGLRDLAAAEGRHLTPVQIEAEARRILDLEFVDGETSL